MKRSCTVCYGKKGIFFKQIEAEAYNFVRSAMLTVNLSKV